MIKNYYDGIWIWRNDGRGLGLVMWIVVLIDLVLLGVFLYKQINK